MDKPTIITRKRLVFALILFGIVTVFLIGRIFYIQIFRAEWLQSKAYEQQTRDRLISPKRGSIFDRNMIGLAQTESVCSISVINSQIKDKEEVAKILSEKLDLKYEDVLTKVSKRLALERIKTKVDKELADEIRKMELPGVVVDEDVKRVYPYGNLASHVIGFVGKDNQGIIGIESKYDKYLEGEHGKILTETDVRGIELNNSAQIREEPIDGYNLVTTIDVIVQQYAEQTLSKVIEAKSAKRGLIIVMNPQNGEIYAMTNKPDFDLNDPFQINSDELQAVWDTLSAEEQNDQLNQMWRNFAINDTYEPGSSFKIVTTAAGFEEGVVSLESRFNCSGSKLVGDRMIKCWRFPRSHGAQTFLEGIQNSCNPVFMEIGEALGAEKFYEYLNKFGFKKKTGIDLPGEAVAIMHELKNVGPVELATMSFGQSFQITPLQLLRAASAAVNGGYLVTPHIGKEIVNDEGRTVEVLQYPEDQLIISKETSDILKIALESVVEVGTGNRTYIPGYRIGGKTATSEKLPRSSNKYIASFVAFAPADDAKVMAIVLVDEPQGTYYGGQVTGPVMKELLENILPYLGVSPIYKENELEMKEVQDVLVPDLSGFTVKEAKEIIKGLELEAQIEGEGETVLKQFPVASERVNFESTIILYTE